MVTVVVISIFTLLSVYCLLTNPFLLFFLIFIHYSIRRHQHLRQMIQMKRTMMTVKKKRHQRNQLFPHPLSLKKLSLHKLLLKRLQLMKRVVMMRTRIVKRRKHQRSQHLLLLNHLSLRLSPLLHLNPHLNLAMMILKMKILMKKMMMMMSRMNI